MNSISQKIIIVIFTVPITLFYGAAVMAHVFIEYSYFQSTLHDNLNRVAKIPGTTIYREPGWNYCADKGIEGVGLSKWYPELCKTDPVRRVMVRSRYAGKEWHLFIDKNNQIVAKNSW